MLGYCVLQCRSGVLVSIDTMASYMRVVVLRRICIVLSNIVLVHLLHQICLYGSNNKFTDHMMKDDRDEMDKATVLFSSSFFLLER